MNWDKQKGWLIHTLGVLIMISGFVFVGSFAISVENIFIQLAFVTLTIIIMSIGFAIGMKGLRLI